MKCARDRAGCRRSLEALCEAELKMQGEFKWPYNFSFHTADGRFAQINMGPITGRKKWINRTVKGEVIREIKTTFVHF